MTQDRYAFVIRLWNETGQSISSWQKPATEIRGSIHPTNSEKIYYFDSFDKIPELLKEITGWDTEEIDSSCNS